MDIQPQSQQSATADQELAKVLAGFSNDAPQSPAIPVPEPATPAASPGNDTPAIPPASQPADNSFSMPQPTTPADATVVSGQASSDLPTPSSPVASDDLESIKKDALNELRPLVDKLELSPEEKFDTYLLLIRSTDDKSLIAPAHTAAQSIADESKKAQALLDIVKEIDYLSSLNK